MDVMMERERDRNERLRELGMKSGRLAEELKRENRMPYDRAILERERFGIVGTGPDRLQERDRLVERVVVKERDEKGMAVNTVGVGIDRLDKVAGAGERNEDKEGTRVPATRVNVFERLRALEREREEERERMREKAREEDQERGEEDEVLRELVSQYKTALLELTFNSKPIITNLTIIAGENLHAARGLAGAVCSHIIEVPKEQKLPSLYLLDSIVKNIGGDYVKYFAQRLPEVFCRAYKQVDPATHPAMQHLFRTWRGVFPPAPLRTIEGELQFQPAANGPSSVNNLSRQAETPAQRTGHAIHVNPKYIEAQRRLQQSGKVDAVPAERNGDAAFREPDRGLAQESSKGWSDTSISRPVHHRGQQGENLRKMGQEGFDQASYPLELENAKPEVGIARGADRYHGWDRIPEGDGAFSKAERASDPRKSHDWRPPLSRSSNVDAFSDSRPGGGKGAASLAPLPQPSQGTTHKSVPSAGNWQNSEDEEEYVWEDMSPHVKNNHDGAIKGPWNQGLSDRATDPRLLDRGADIRLPERPADVRLGRGKRPSPDTDNAWHRRLSSPRIEHGIDDRFASSKELEDRLRPPLSTNLELAEIGKPSFDSLFESNIKPGQHMMRPPLPLSDFSVIGGTRGMRNVLESAHPPPRSGTPPIPSPTGSGLGNLFGGALPNLPPSNVPSYSILKHLQRQPTPPPPPQLPMQPLPPPPPLSSLSHQLQIPSFSRHQTQLKSSLPGSQFSQHMQGHVLQNMKNQLPQPLPFLQHLQVQPPQILPPSQPQPPPPPPQVPDSMLSFPQLQSQSQVQQARPINFAPESVQNGVIESAVPNTSNLLAQFLQSGLIPPSQASQLLTEPQPPQSQHSMPQPQPPPESPLQSQTDLGSQPSLQMKPPLPSGPPPMQFLNHITASSFLSSSMLLPPSVPSSGGSSTSIRSTQPPLPPGPPPTSTIVGGPASNISSLLSSLMAHGLISASLPSSSASTPGGGTDSLPVPAAPNPPLDALRNVTKILPASNVPILTPPMHLPSSDGINQTSSGLQNDAIGTEFKQEILRERHESVINSLYLDFPRQCKTCGLRFKAQEEHSKHMDWHVARNRRQKNQKKSSRMWFVSLKEWLGGTGTSVSEVARPFFAEESPVEVAEDNERLAVPADENQSACALCGEPFEDFYSDETDEWMYKGAVYMNIPPGNSIEGLDGSALGPIVHAKCRTESDAAAAANFVDMDKETRSDEVREENCHLPQVDISKVKEELEPTGGPRKRVRY